MWQYYELEKESESENVEKRPCLVITQEQSSRLLKTLVQFLPSEERKKDRRKDKILKRDHSFLSSLQCVWGGQVLVVSPGVTSCDPGLELLSQKTWYVWPVQPLSLGLQTSGQAQEPGGSVP